MRYNTLKTKNKNTREGILESARRLFAQFGPKKTTIDEIAQEAGVGKGTIYYYFNDKEDIFLKVVQEEAEQLAGRLKSVASGPENPEQKLTAVFMEKLRSFSDFVNLRWLYDFIDSGRWSGLKQETMALAQKEQTLVEGILKEGQSLGIFAIEDVSKIAQNLLRVVSALSKTLPQGMSPGELKQSLEDMIEFILNGLRSRQELKPQSGE
jgi:AcrR family transcriptional regulator